MNDSNDNKIREHHYMNHIIIIAVIVVLIYILFATGIIKITSKNTSPSKKDEIPEQVEKTKLKTTDNTVTTLYKNVELGRSYNALRHYYFYSYDSLYVKYMDDAFIKEMALSKLTLLDSTTVDASILEKQYKNIVGNNIVYNNRTFQTQCSTLKYNATLNNYTIIKNTSCDTTKPDNYEYFDKIEEAYKYNDRIEIITRVGYAEDEKELVSEGVYQSTGKIIIKKDMDTQEKIGVFSESLDQIKKSIDYTKLTKYKYTFRLNNAKYYFYSIEKVED